MLSTQIYLFPLCKCTKIDRMHQNGLNGLKWTKYDRMDQIESKWTEWTKYDQSSPNRTEEAQSGPNKIKVERMD